MKYSDIAPSPYLAEIFDGWNIVSTGMTKFYFRDTHKGSVEGGLTFILEKNGKRKKVILGYNELGEWLEHEEEV